MKKSRGQNNNLQADKKIKKEIKKKTPDVKNEAVKKHICLLKPGDLLTDSVEQEKLDKMKITYFDL